MLNGYKHCGKYNTELFSNRKKFLTLQVGVIIDRALKGISSFSGVIVNNQGVATFKG
jgi:hypothetical protein